MLVLQILAMLVSSVLGIQDHINDVFRRLADYASDEMRRMKASDEIDRKIYEQKTEILRSDYLAGVKLEGLNM